MVFVEALVRFYMGERDCLVKLGEIRGDCFLSSNFTLILIWPEGGCLMEFDEIKDSEVFSSKFMFISGLV